MSDTLVYGGTTIVLPVSASWTDEFKRRPIKQVVDRSESGHLIIENWSLVLGDTVTIGGPASVVTYAELAVIKSLESVTDALTLTWKAQAMSVVWDHSQSVPAIEASPLLPDLVEPGADDLYRVTLHFFEV